jgi:hypothetical protein
MNTMNVNGQNGAATSAVAKMFVNVSVNEVADKFIRKIRRSDNMVAKISVMVSDDVKVEIDGTLYGEGNYIANVHIFQKGGNGRYYELGKKQIKSDVANSTGVALSEVYYGVQDMMEQIAQEQEDNTIDVTEEDVINEVVEVINANLIDDATEGQKLDWTLFSDSTMEYLFANGGPELYEKIKNGVKSRRIAEVLAYDDCFYVWYDEEPAKNDAPCLDEDDVYAVVEQLCTDMQEKMIECGDFMIGYKYAEPDFQGRSAEWFEDMIFVTKKSDLDENGDYVWDDCEVFRIGDYFTFVVELLRGDFDVIADIKDAIVECMGNNGDLIPALASENVRDYFEKNNDERAFFVLPDYDYVCGLFVEYNEDDDVYVAMGNDSWNVTEYDGNTDMSVVIADFSNAWAKEIDDYCDGYKDLDYDMKIYRNDDYDGYMILLNSGVDHGLNVEEGYDPYKGDYVEVIA